jgi:hypothetical protein
MRKFKVLSSAVLGISTLLGAGTCAFADTVNITAIVQTPSPTQIVDVHYGGNPSAGLDSIGSVEAYAGQINWTNTVVGNTDIGGGLLGSLPASFGTGTFSSYCIDITQDINIGQPATFDGLFTGSNLANTPVVAPSNNYQGMGTTAASAIQSLYDNEYDTISPSDNDQAAAFQIAIWYIIYSTNPSHSSVDVTNSGNDFYISGASANVIGLADSYVDQAYLGDLPATTHHTILALTDEVYQDQLVVGIASNDAPPSVPAPSAAVAGISLLAGLGVWKRIRRVR